MDWPLIYMSKFFVCVVTSDKYLSKHIFQTCSKMTNFDISMNTPDCVHYFFMKYTLLPKLSCTIQCTVILRTAVDLHLLWWCCLHNNNSTVYTFTQIIVQEKKAIINTTDWCKASAIVWGMIRQHKLPVARTKNNLAIKNEVMIHLHLSANKAHRLCPC